MDFAVAQAFFFCLLWLREWFMVKFKRIYSHFEVRTTIFTAKELKQCSVTYEHIIFACGLKLHWLMW